MKEFLEELSELLKFGNELNGYQIEQIIKNPSPYYKMLKPFIHRSLKNLKFKLERN
jgi:hypothetical protein